jgi:hypothetical protein
MSNTDGYEQPVDAVQAAAEALQYGDTETAIARLRQAIQAESQKVSQHLSLHDKIVKEQARTNAATKKFEAENPQFFKDPVANAATRSLVISEQLVDLKQAGFDHEAFRRDYGRDPNDREIANEHLKARALGVPHARPVERLMDDVATQIEASVPAARRSIHDPEVGRTRRIHQMEDESRRRKGLPPLEREEPAPRQHQRSGDQVANEDTIRNLTIDSFGRQDNEEENEATRMTNRRNAISVRMIQTPSSRALGETRLYGRPMDRGAREDGRA